MLDLGASPGGWSQVAINELKGRGRVFSVDLLHMEHLEGASVFEGDIRDPTLQSSIRKEMQDWKKLIMPSSSSFSTLQPSIASYESPSTLPQKTIAATTNTSSNMKFNVLLSDMAHKFTGSKSVDVPRMHNLVRFALEVAKSKQIGLCQGGSLVSKYLNGKDDEILLQEFKSLFKQTFIFKPKSCRAESTEAYLIGKGFLYNDN